MHRLPTTTQLYSHPYLSQVLPTGIDEVELILITFWLLSKVLGDELAGIMAVCESHNIDLCLYPKAKAPECVKAKV